MMLLGVEIELAVVGNPDPNSQHISNYEIFDAGNKEKSVGRVHTRNGNLAQAVEVVSNNQIKVGYDESASHTKVKADGFELQGPPVDLEGNREVWSYIYNSWLTKYLEASPKCGMHIHVSSDDIDINVLVRLGELLCLPANRDFITYVAGRYDTQYCLARKHDRARLAMLFHEPHCNGGRKIDLAETPFLTGGFCCNNLRELRFAVENRVFRRYGLNVLPTANTGHIELRLFSAPATVDQFLYRLDFSHALICYCIENGDPTFRGFCDWLQESRNRRSKYRSLFRWLRDGRYVEGTIRG